MRSSRTSPENACDPKILSQETVTYTDGYDPARSVASCPMTEIDMITSGTGIHRFFGQSVPCGEGDIYIVQENVPHGFCAAEDSDGRGLTVRRIFLSIPDLLDADTSTPETPAYCCGVFQGGSTVACAMLTQAARREVLLAADAMFAEAAEQAYEWKRAVRAYLELMLITVSRYLRAAVQTDTSVSGKERGVVLSVIRSVDEHFGESDLTLERIAADHYMSASVLSRLFDRYMGQPFSEFLRNYRLDQACRLLRQTDEPINSIASHVGIRDIPTFYRIFNRYAGMTPGRYRRDSAVVPSPDTHGLLAAISENLQAGKPKDVTLLVTEALENGFSPQAVLTEGLIAGMTVVGEKFKNSEVFVPEVLMASRAMTAGMQILGPALQTVRQTHIGKAVIGTVKGDMHDIGKNLVIMMLEGHGIECIDLGVDVDSSVFVDAVRAHKPDVVCLSSLLTTTMPEIRAVINALTAAGLRQTVKVMVGGAPVTDSFADEVGADVYTPDAAAAADAAVELCRGKK